MSDACSPSTSSRQLQVAKPGELKAHGLKHSSYKGETSQQQFHIFSNHTDKHLQLSWVWKGGEKRHGAIGPHSHLYVGTYSFHEWLIKDENGLLVGAYKGESATIEIKVNGCSVRLNSTVEDPSYKCRGSVLAMDIWAFDCVGTVAIARVQHVVTKMLECSPSYVLERLCEKKASFGIVGRGQAITDCPPHRFMKAVYKDRDLDSTCRGLGGTLSVPCTALSEENLTMEDDRWYPAQSILVHELAHMVLNLALVTEVQKDLMECYELARRGDTYPKDSYLLTNEQEFFAVLTESWFESTLRDDLNGGVRSRESVKQKDPLAAKIMLLAWGDGSWRFTHDSPAPLTLRKRKKDPEPEPEPEVETSPAPLRSTMERSQPRDGGASAQKRRLMDDDEGEEGFRDSLPYFSAAAVTRDLCLSSCFPSRLLGLDGMGDTEILKENKMR